MIPSKRDIIIRSLRHHRGTLFSLSLTALLVTAVITASVLAGYSVRQTLYSKTAERLDGGAVLASSGLRFTELQLARDLQEILGVEAVPMLSLNGYAGKFETGTRAMDVNIWGVERLADMPERGEAVINRRLAEALAIEEDQFLILRFTPPSDLPSNTPFSPEKGEEGSLFLRVKRVADTVPYANFNLSVSQIIPYNIFVNLEEFGEFFPDGPKINRIVVAEHEAATADEVRRAVAALSQPGSIGLRIRPVGATGGYEVISDRVFIDSHIVSSVTSAIGTASPVLTWLANRVESDSGSTPYSFIAAVSGSSGITEPYDMVINSWMADDLQVGVDDSVTVAYYVTGRGNELVERSAHFRVSAVVPLEGVWRDSLLMPEFPGIAGARSCTEWDAGVPLDLDAIRDKDEDYWYDFGGTPKGFISYETGMGLWGNQFGPATAIRFDSHAGAAELKDDLESVADIRGYGIAVTDLLAEGVRAARGGVDFSMLFLALSIFIIASSLIMTVMIVQNHMLQRQGEVRTLSALGFNRRTIVLLFTGESAVPLAAGVLVGAAAGMLFNRVLIAALNSVWSGAVQTDTLVAHAAPLPVVAAMLPAAALALLTVVVTVRRFLAGSTLHIRPGMSGPKALPRWLLPLAAMVSVALFLAPVVTDADVTLMQFAGGAVAMIFLLLLLHAALMRGVAGRYWAFFPGRGVTPATFIAAGLFVVIATGVNRRDFSREADRRDGGTGGFTHWIETTIPVEENLNNEAVQRRRGIYADDGLLFMAMPRVDGDDASCLNLHQIATPHILGVDGELLSQRQSFSFATRMRGAPDRDIWSLLEQPAGENAIYGVLDQTVMQWGMMIKAGDTVTVTSESGEPLHVIVAGGLRSSVFQGHMLVDASHLARWFPSVAGSSVLLAESGSGDHREVAEMLSSSLDPFGPVIESTPSRLEAFYSVNNTYLSVFLLLGGIGMVLGVVGQGLNVRRGIEHRKREYALMVAAGFRLKTIRRMVMREQIFIVAAGVATGVLSAAAASAAGLIRGGELPLGLIALLVLLMVVAGVASLLLSLRTISREELTAALRGQ